MFDWGLVEGHVLIGANVVGCGAVQGSVASLSMSEAPLSEASEWGDAHDESDDEVSGPRSSWRPFLPIFLILLSLLVLLIL
jgi:hypothetical protein